MTCHAIAVSGLRTAFGEPVDLAVASSYVCANAQLAGVTA